MNEKDEVIKLRKHGHTYKNISIALGITIYYVQKWCAEENLKKPERYDCHFLDTESPLRSYFLGLLMADGWVSSRDSVYLSSTDEQIIQDIAVAVKYQNTITIVQNRKWKSHEKTGKSMYRLSFSKKEFTDKIKNMGFSPNKTGNEFLPAQVSDDTFRDFLRGFSDGDGWITLDKVGRANWGVICSSQKFLQTLAVKITQLILPGRHILSKIKKRSDCDVYRLRLAHKDAMALCEWMYRDANLFLLRKYQKYLQGKKHLPAYTQWSTAEITMALNGEVPPNRTKAGYNALLRSIQKGYRITPL